MESASVMTPLKGALHVHTTCSDGALSPEEALRVYRDLRFDFVALTDHDFLLRPGAYDRIPDEFEGMLVFRGVEQTIFARGYLHVNRIEGDSETLHVFNHPAEYALAINQVLERIHEVERTIRIDAVEVTLQGFYTAEYDVEALPYPKVASDDSHTREGCGRAWIEVACAKNKDAVIRAIRNGRARVCYNGTAHRAAWSNRGGVASG
ncbi:MAG TPA: PHP-associated domain-containing protein [Candidatus Hydrogenedentes bacterium]|nr:PHP-associated domain-containing protein [Candidatus Hydrogenedentota bacterium]HOV73957.1 PHP-associated domain-containing protein [Candidatus Hydrogenedentota bacterium]HPC14823.1 PHP-associated domain-containing protein [Candidatus Hydrogenedentota bacterium]HRT18687.1 PHP-associated domain-containing protein [Candidatus Hydrogenedentota bacterium]HRT63707.1 PHP-associated domain-containing protein [Candidatus Hydrogenedentota bacterium]